MSQSFPPNPGGYQQNPGGYLPTPGGYHQNPYAGHPAYAGYPGPTPRSSELNPWIAALFGAMAGGFLTFLLMTLVPMLLFGFAMGGGPFGDEGFMDTSGRVSVASDGSVTGAALAEALEDTDWYERATCPDTAKVATDATTICEANDGFEDLRVVVVFDGTDGRFATADLWE